MLFERYEFPFEVVYPRTLDAGDLNSRFDVLLFPDVASDGPAQPAPETVPEKYRPLLGHQDRRDRGAAAQEIRPGRRLDRHCR